MALKTAEQYEESLRKMNLKVYLLGERGNHDLGDLRSWISAGSGDPRRARPAPSE